MHVPSTKAATCQLTAASESAAATGRIAAASRPGVHSCSTADGWRLSARGFGSLTLCAVLFSARAASAQHLQPELRVDAFWPAPVSVQPGVGLTLPLGYYVRVSASAGYAPHGDARLIDDHWRGDLVARFLLDPFRQQRWGLSLGGGLSVREKTYLAALLDLEGPEWHHVMPALEIGVSGGVRAGVVFRRAVRDRR